ncbi:MAG: sensor domain-containing diguanylate cyclase [Bacilli bacterium]|nr:sensor domain-containing diguanylate cyclase [Bacilli bacterium]MBN2877136.1 sensor domain-containing diguanylate cyclase [Bacilli bacterium]
MDGKWGIPMSIPLYDFFEGYECKEESGFVVFFEDGTIFSFNSSFPKIMEIDKDILLHSNVKDLFSWQEGILETVLNGDTIKESFLDAGKFLQVYIGPMHCQDDRVKGFIVVSDKTEIQTYINDLRESLDNFKELINHFHIGLAVFDDSSNLIEANDIFCENLGYTQEEVVRLNARDFIYDYDNRTKSQKRDVNKIIFFGQDNQHIHKNGTLIPIKGYASIREIAGKRIAVCLYENIEEIKKSSARLEQSETMLQNFISNSSDVVLVLDNNLQIFYISPNTKKVFGYNKSIPKAEIAKRYFPLKDKQFLAFIRASMRTKESATEFEYIIKQKNNIIKTYSVRTSTVTFNQKMIICYIRDVTKDKKYIEELKILSFTDQLTKLHNRQYMEEQLFELRKSENYPISIISADLDGLKEVNDSLGHQAGDELLRRFAAILKESHDKDEEIFRIGGDEFIIIATNTDEKAAETLVHHINHRITSHNSLPSSLLKISVSIGFSTSLESSSNLSTMLALADKEMYRVKNLKKNNQT